MEFNPDNKVVQLCGQGMEQEVNGQGGWKEFKTQSSAHF